MANFRLLPCLLLGMARKWLALQAGVIDFAGGIVVHVDRRCFGSHFGLDASRRNGFPKSLNLPTTPEW